MNFIETYKVDHDMCDKFIDLFHKFKSHHSHGQVMMNDKKGGQQDKNIKDSTDLSINWWNSQSQPTVKKYQEILTNNFLDYRKKYEMVQKLSIGLANIFNIQHYKPNGGYKAWHFERHHNEQLRIFAFMTYLNDDFEGGKTTFNHYDLDVKPVTGRTMIWPSEWTHAHQGQIITKGSKYIITGWLNIPL